MNTTRTLALGACLSLLSLGVSAQSVDGDVEASGDGYISAGGMVLKTGLGECLQTGNLSDDNVINKCAGIEDDAVADAEAAAKAEAEAAEKALADAAAAEEAAKAQALAEAEAAKAAAAAEATQTAKIDTRQFSEMALFDTNSAALNADGTSMMNNLFSALSEYKGITEISIVGHTDSRGTDAYNQALSEQRAATVAAQISSQYPGANIEVKGMGESSPIATNDTAEGRQQNRRVDIEITATRMTFN